jgi:predicted extracellular nuclease
MRYGIKTLFSFFTLIIFSGCATLPSLKKEKIQTIAFYNVENLYDTKGNARNMDFTPTGARQWTEERYRSKLNNIASVLVKMGNKGGPAVIGLSEVESKTVLEDLINTPLLRESNYKFIHHESEDPLGLDVALLYKEKYFKPSENKVIRIDYKEANFKSKDILQVKGKLLGESITFYINHWPPDGDNARRGMQRKNAAATALRKAVDEQFSIEPDASIILMGDFDDEPNATVIEKVLKATGSPDPAKKDAFFNTFYMAFVDGKATYLNKGDKQVIDQIMISKSLIDLKGLEFVRGSPTIYMPEAIKYTFGKYKNTPKSTFSGTTYIGGYSNHFPVYIKVKKMK